MALGVIAIEKQTAGAQLSSALAASLPACDWTACIYHLLQQTN